MADRIQHRRDTAERWATFNPVLLEGEIGFVLDNPNQYKIGDGVHTWNELPLRGFTGNISQNTGYDENAVMSQKATTEKLSELASTVGVYEKYSVDSSSGTNKTMDVSLLPKGKYYIKPIMQGLNPPSSINIYRTRDKESGLIEPLYKNCVSGEFVEIELTEETNWLWFWKTDEGYEYTLSFELYSEESTVYKLSKKEEVLAEEIAKNKESVNTLDKEVNGVRGTFNILSTEQTNKTVNVSDLQKGKYYVKPIMQGLNPPSSINIYRAREIYGSELIEPLYTNCVSGEFVEIELTEETNWLWFWKTDEGYEYTLSFELYSEESIKGRLHSIEVVGMDNKDTIKHILNNISEKKYTELQVEEIKEGSVLNSVGNIAYHSKYSVETYSLDGINRIRVHGNGGTSTIITYGFFKSSNINSENLIEIGPVHTPTYDYEVDVPEGATHVACTKYMYQTLKVYSVELGDIKQPMETTESSTILYTVENKRVWVSTASGIKQIVVGIQVDNDGVGNGLPDIRSIGTADLGIIPSDGSVNVLHYASSDWIAPFKIRAVNNADGDDVSGDTFTGGSHQYNNQITGSTPTARLVSMKTYIDGKSVSSGSGYCSSIEVEWVTRIQGSNTRKSDGSGREILEEKVTFTFDGKEWKVRTTLLPLEDLYMDRWYGYQFTGINTIFNTWRYVNGATREDNVDDSGNGKTVAMFAEGEEVSLEMWVDTTIDLGNRELCKNYGLTRSAFKSGNKGYFWIVDNSEVLKANNRYYLEGKYIIKLK